MSVLYIGNHTSSSKGYAAMARQTNENGGNTFAFFTRNPRGGRAKAIDEKDIQKFLFLAREYHFGKIVAHAPYVLNACAAKEDFEELQEILNRVERKEKMGICLDTCHIWDGGYDIVNNLDGVLDEFDRVIGLKRLKAVHLNDSLNTLGSHKDRHARIGEGQIGLDALVRIIKHPALKEIPFILETPNDDAGWAEEIRILKEAFYQ